MQELTARDLMTTPPIACREEAFFEEVAETLADRDISGLPVVDGECHVVGVLSERDLAHALGSPLVRLAVRRHGDGVVVRDILDMPRHARRARHLMTTPAVTCDEDASLAELARSMAEHEINRLPVVRDGKLVGIVTRGDVLRAVGHLPHKGHTSAEETILVGIDREVGLPTLALRD